MENISIKCMLFVKKIKKNYFSTLLNLEWARKNNLVKCMSSSPLISSGLNADVTIFDEEEIVAGDIVTVELDLEVLKMMQKTAGLPSDGITKVSLSLAHDCVYVSVLAISIAAVELPPLANEEHESSTDLTTCRLSRIS